MPTSAPSYVYLENLPEKLESSEKAILDNKCEKDAFISRQAQILLNVYASSLKLPVLVTAQKIHYNQRTKSRLSNPKITRL
ncbi:hypothetical protein H5410_015827 [Solanum commersonii]|uniref:Uncharacterized protein n=1 Tax=Solanum commersonii TaxID=4109 RepID=A0A9J5ZV82_SOLCO|nr:hypothetical protein H5410_015827 [Solanum commersonii]